MLCAVVLCSTTASAQKTNDVPAAAKAAFTRSYPNAGKVKWDKEDRNYEASFKNNGNETSVVYTNVGAVVETETSLAVSALPANARNYASKLGTIKEASKIETADGTIMYEAEVKGKDLMFDAKGDFLKAKTDEDAD